MDLHYGTGDVYGYESFDQVCISPSICTSQFSFLAVNYQNGLDSLMGSGIIGMSPTKSAKMGTHFV
jgi:hypothetical protein